MLLTIKDTAEALNVSVEHVRKMMKRRMWPFHKLGLRTYRLDPDAIKKLTLKTAGKDRQ